MDSFKTHPSRWQKIYEVSSPATGRNYRGGISTYSYYRNNYTGGQMGWHIIDRMGDLLHSHPRF